MRNSNLSQASAAEPVIPADRPWQLPTSNAGHTAVVLGRV